MNLINDPLFYLVAIPAVLFTGISKGGFGSAVGGLGVPLMALVISPPQAAAILLPVLCLMDLVGFRVYYQKWDALNLRIMIPGALIGIAIGTLTFGMFKEDSIRIILGAIALLFTLNNWVGFARRQEAKDRSVVKGTIGQGYPGSPVSLHTQAARPLWFTCSRSSWIKLPSLQPLTCSL